LASGVGRDTCARVIKEKPAIFCIAPLETLEGAPIFRAADPSGEHFMQDEHTGHSATDLAAEGADAAPAVSAAEASPAELGQALAELSGKLEAAEAQVREHQDAFLRAKAETENVRKRASADLQQARKFAVESFAAELIAVRDSLEAALGIQNADLDSYRSGVELTLRQLTSALEKFHVVVIDPTGDRFDPNRHQAISMLESTEHEPNTVMSVMQKGYALHERVLRPAFVTVAKAPQTN
jgi:molecular chaperone GrpE